MNDEAAAQLTYEENSMETQDRAIATGSIALALGAMVVDHLLGDDPGLEDPAMFLIASALILGLAGFMFGRVIPAARAADDPADRGAKDGLAASVIAVIPGIATLWLGLPFVLAGAGLVLGREAVRRKRTRRGIVAIVIGTVVLIGASVAYVVQAVDKMA